MFTTQLRNYLGLTTSVFLWPGLSGSGRMVGGCSEMKTFGASAFFMIMLLVNGLFTAFVAQHFWNWFITVACHVSEIGFWGMYGFVLLVSLFSSHQENPADDIKWEGLMTVVQASVPEEHRGEVSEQIKGIADGAEGRVFSLAFMQLSRTALTLAIGWGVHAFLA